MLLSTSFVLSIVIENKLTVKFYTTALKIELPSFYIDLLYNVLLGQKKLSVTYFEFVQKIELYVHVYHDDI